jgi:hypothetical protein
MAIGGGASGKSITKSTPSLCSLVELCAPPTLPPRCAHHGQPAPPPAPTSRSRRRGPSNHVFLLDHFSHVCVSHSQSPHAAACLLRPISTASAASNCRTTLPQPPPPIPLRIDTALLPRRPSQLLSSQRTEKEDVRVMPPHRRSPEVGGAHDMICQVGFQVRLTCSVSFC